MMGTRSTTRLGMSSCCVDSHSLAMPLSPGNEVPVCLGSCCGGWASGMLTAHWALFLFWAASFLLL